MVGTLVREGIRQAAEKDSLQVPVDNHQLVLGIHLVPDSRGSQRPEMQKKHWHNYYLDTKSKLTKAVLIVFHL